MPINGANDIITIPFDRDKTNITWSNDDKYYTFTSQSNGGTILNRVNIKTKKVEALSNSDIGVSSFDLANNTVVYAKTEVANPSELYFANTDFKNNEKEVILTDG
jgi:dipeptidyl aminopeptidase/acylaminoacyl peptidase